MTQLKYLVPVLFFLPLHSAIPVFVREDCPAKEDIYPCSCSEEGSFIAVKCRKGSTEDFQKAFDNLRGKFVSVTIDCYSSPCTLKASMFWDLKLQTLKLGNVELEGTLDEESRESISHVTNLQIYRSTRLARDLPNWDLGSLKKLKQFRVWSNNMTEISNKMFETGPVSLTDLSITQNDLQTIGDEAFASLTNLFILDLRQNRIRSIQRSMLPKKATSLEIISFSNNKLSSLPEDLFDNMPSLKHVYLFENLISKLPAAPWSTIWEQLSSLGLHYNPLVCDADMNWMFTKSQPKDLTGICRSPEKMNGTALGAFIDKNT